MSSTPEQALSRARTVLRGFTPRRLRARLDGPRVFANSVPKSGTNLLTRCLYLFPMLRPCLDGVSLNHVSMNQNRTSDVSEFRRKMARTGRGQYSSGHVFYTKENAAIVEHHDITVLLIVRDPRDVVTSHFHYVTEKNTSHRLNEYYASLPGDHERLLASIRGVPGEQTADGDPLESIGEWMNSFLRWADESYVQVVRFEDLIGPQGGGGKPSQVETVRTIADHLGVDLSPGKVEYVADNTFSTDSSTFRKGLIGDWRNHFDPEHVEAFDDEAGAALVELGYEDGRQWGV